MDQTSSYVLRLMAMPQGALQPDPINPSIPERNGPADRRLGERRLQLVDVQVERRGRGDRRRPVGRRESASGHIRNAIQVLENALVTSERDGDPVARETLLAAIERLHHALHEVDRLVSDRVRLGQLLRVAQRGLPPDVLPGLRGWLGQP